MRQTGIVLCGGGSSRMVRPKALLPWRGRTLMETVVREVDRFRGDEHAAWLAFEPGRSADEPLAGSESVPLVVTTESIRTTIGLPEGCGSG